MYDQKLWAGRGLFRDARSGKRSALSTGVFIDLCFRTRILVFGVFLDVWFDLHVVCLI